MEPFSNNNIKLQDPKFSNKSKKELNVAELIEDEDEPPKKDSRFLLPKVIMEHEQQDADKNVGEERKETILEWYEPTLFITQFIFKLSIRFP